MAVCAKVWANAKDKQTERDRERKRKSRRRGREEGGRARRRRGRGRRKSRRRGGKRGPNFRVRTLHFRSVRGPHSLHQVCEARVKIITSSK
jgi:hypothetical protein